LVTLDPLLTLVASFIFLAIMLYKRVPIGITLVSSALVMSFLSLGPGGVFAVLRDTTFNSLTISLVLVTIGIMVLSVLYKETKTLDQISRSFGGLFKNPKLVVSCLPAIVGLLPVPGGALMSAPLVETEAEKLGLSQDKKTYVNVWFRHTIFPIYPMSQVLILTAALTGVSTSSIILSQIPVVIVMALVGYATVLRKAQVTKNTNPTAKVPEHLRNFLIAFSPILAMILTAAIVGIDVSIAALIGIILLLLITKPRLQTLFKTVSNVLIYKIALAAYGAMLLRTATMASGVSEVLGQMVATSNISEVFLLVALPGVLAFTLGSLSGGIAVSVPIIAGTLNFTSSSAGLLYISAFLGYLASPAHLCLVLTSDYFKSPISRVYRLLGPSIAFSFATAIGVYLLL